MFNKKNCRIPIDDFINNALYHPQKGYYIKKNPFGKNGDFITSPNISILFSEMIAIWCIAYWQYLGCPKKFNIIELGSGNGEMASQIIAAFKNFNIFNKSYKYLILEKSEYLKKLQKEKINLKNVRWLKKIDEVKDGPNIFIANEFFDSLPVKQFFKKNNSWFERNIKKTENNKFIFIDILTNINKLEKKIGIQIKKNQNIIEYSPLTLEYLKIISKKINKNKGGLLFFDYGYFEEKMKNTLQSIKKHKPNNILKNFSNSDITYEINFSLIKKIARKFGLYTNGLTTQGSFLTKIGIIERAEILAKNYNFRKKADIYYRLKRLVDKNFMGNQFKVMFLTKKNIRFKLGF